MRYLHPVSAHEKFVASGVYNFYVQDQPVGIVEDWSIHELPDGGQLIRADMDARNSTLSARMKCRDILIEAWRSPLKEGGRIERLDVRVYGTKEDEVKVARVNLSFDTKCIHITYSLDDNPSQQKEVALPANCVVAGGSALFTGFVTAEVAQFGGADVPVFTYSTPLEHANNVFVSHVNESSQKLVGEDTLTIAGKSILARRFQSGPAVGGEDYLSGTTEWLDQYNILVQSDNGRTGVVLLTQYARRPEPKP